MVTNLGGRKQSWLLVSHMKLFSLAHACQSMTMTKVKKAQWGSAIFEDSRHCNSNNQQRGYSLETRPLEKMRDQNEKDKTRGVLRVHK